MSVVGLDVAEAAVEYAVGAGLLDDGVCENLEERDPSGRLAGRLTDVGLVTVTGGLSYVTGTTFDRLLACASADARPWIAAFSLRWADMTPIAVDEMLAPVL